MGNDDTSVCMRDKRKCRIKSRATIICLRSGRVLLVRKKGGKWNFPGGLIEPGESLMQLRQESYVRRHPLKGMACFLCVQSEWGQLCITSSPPDSTKMRSPLPTMKLSRVSGCFAKSLPLNC